MNTRTCALFVFNGYEDWEPALAIVGLRKYGNFTIQTFSTDGKPVESMGGLTVVPTHSLADLDPASFDLLLLPGGDAWEQGGNQEIIPFIEKTDLQRTKIAAICAATTLLGRMGLLNHVGHTSNALDYLKALAPGYVGEGLYQHEPAISDGNIITANGAGMIEFAHQIYQSFQLFDTPTLEAVRDLYKSGGMENRLYA